MHDDVDFFFFFFFYPSFFLHFYPFLLLIYDIALAGCALWSERVKHRGVGGCNVGYDTGKGSYSYRTVQWSE